MANLEKHRAKLYTIKAHNRSTTCGNYLKPKSKLSKDSKFCLNLFLEKYGKLKTRKNRLAMKKSEGVTRNKTAVMISKSIERVRGYLASEESEPRVAHNQTIFQADPFKIMNDSYENAYDLPSPKNIRFFNSEKKV